MKSISENGFGILVNRWRVFMLVPEKVQKKKKKKKEKVKTVTLAPITLYNWQWEKSENWKIYTFQLV